MYLLGIDDGQCILSGKSNRLSQSMVSTISTDAWSLAGEAQHAFGVSSWDLLQGLGSTST